uniref:DNA-directed DNA polymerase family A palm domain-containing protein n=1 Tax=Timema bartmani TaxID=61472 RepID=A0A7R9I244_9NEOP|nr:unnamed protein product [Timema bartmani]
MSNVCYNESLMQEKSGFSNNYKSINEESDEESNKIWDDIGWFDVLTTTLKNCQKQNSISDSLNSSDASFITNQIDDEFCVINKHDSCDEHIINYNNDLSNDSISFSDICDQHSFFDGGKVNSSCDEQKYNSPRSTVQVCPESSNDVQMLNSQTSQFMNIAKISNSNSQFDKVSEDDFSWLDEISFTGTPDKHICTDSHKHKNEKSSPESKKLRNNILLTKTSPSIEESSDILISQETKQIVCGKNKQEIKNNPKVKQKIFRTKTAIDNTHITVSFMNPFLPKLSRKSSNKKMNTINKPFDALRKEHFISDDNEDNKSEVTIGSANITSNAEKITKLDMSKPRTSLSCRKTRKLVKKESPLIQTTLHFNKKHSENMLEKRNEEAICFNFLTEEMFADIENKMVEHEIQEVALTIIYKEGFCQLNKPEKSSKSAQCTRSGIMFAISSINSDTKYYFLRINPGDSTNTGATRNFLQYLLSSPFRKICYEAQEMYSYLIDMFHFPARQVCLTWLLLDPLVGSWLLDPDQPIHTFSEAIDRFGTKPAITEDGEIEVRISLANALVVLSPTAEDEEIEVRISGQIDLLEAAAHKAAGKPFHLNSTVQLRSILYEELKLDQKHSIHIKETISLKAKSTSEPVLRQLEAVHPLPGIILKYRHLHKIRSTYVEGMIQHIQRNYIFTTWEQTAAATGRLTSSNPNLQAVPKHQVSLKSHVTAGFGILADLLTARYPGSIPFCLGFGILADLLTARYPGSIPFCLGFGILADLLTARYPGSIPFCLGFGILADLLTARYPGSIPFCLGFGILADLLTARYPGSIPFCLGFGILADLLTARYPGSIPFCLGFGILADLLTARYPGSIPFCLGFGILADLLSTGSSGSISFC